MTSAPLGEPVPPTPASQREPEVYDLVGVGLGPFNLSLAALADQVPGLRAVFVDAKPAFSWYPGLLLAGTTLQVPFLADLVTLVDPTSRWSYLSYLAAHDRLFRFYFAESFHVPRTEYDHYCGWVARSLPSCRFGNRVTAVRWDAEQELFRVESTPTGPAGAAAAAAPVTDTVLARNLVLGVGTEPLVPASLRPLLGAEVFPVTAYGEWRDALADVRHVTVVGSGQSGAEVVLDLLRGASDAARELLWITRAAAFAPMEYSKLGLEHFTPDYTDYFRALPGPTRERLLPSQWQLYKAISAETIAEIYGVLYERTVAGRPPGLTLLPNAEVMAGHRQAGHVELVCRQREQDREFTVGTDRVVLATGFGARRPTLLGPVADLVDWDEAGRYRVDAEYRVAMAPSVTGRLYVQNAEAHTHGVGAPDLGLGAYRAARILNDLVAAMPAGTGTGTGADTGVGGAAGAGAGRDVSRPPFRLPPATAFTRFGVRAGERLGLPADTGPGGAPASTADAGGGTDAEREPASPAVRAASPHRRAASPARAGGVA